MYVLDQDEALDFYVNTLGLEVAADLDLGFMRWLTVRVPGDPAREILLERPGPPVMDDATAAQVRELADQGRGGRRSVLHRRRRARHVRSAKERGVDVTDEPETRPYGIDFGIRDPFGNAIRIGQMFD